MISVNDINTPSVLYRYWLFFLSKTCFQGLVLLGIAGIGDYEGRVIDSGHAIEYAAVLSILWVALVLSTEITYIVGLKPMGWKK